MKKRNARKSRNKRKGNEGLRVYSTCFYGYDSNTHKRVVIPLTCFSKDTLQLKYNEIARQYFGHSIDGCIACISLNSDGVEEFLLFFEKGASDTSPENSDSDQGCKFAIKPLILAKSLEEEQEQVLGLLDKMEEDLRKSA